MEGRGVRGRARGRRLAAALIAASLLAATSERPAGASEPAREVGFVESFEGAAADYRIERGGSRLPVFVLAPLEDGDLVHVAGAGGRITLRIGAGAARVVDASAAPFRVEGSGEERTLALNVARWLGDWVQGRAPGEEAGGVSLVTRGVGLRAPLLAPPARLAAGRRDALHLAWSGGTPPYAVRLSDAGGRVLFEAAGGAAQVASGALELSPGALALAITDAKGQRLDARLEVRGETPSPPAQLAVGDPAPPLRALLEAAWLAGTEGGAWRLEAYQRAAADAAGYAPARALRDALASGALAPALEADR